jgi:Cu(I)/Ag(I) efflux system membrane fusion protein
MPLPSARADTNREARIFKPLVNMLKKNQAIYKLYSEDIAIAKQDYFLAYNN